mgnify:CR=1 FL=1|tara:strand:- start:739 stop:1017 length:279 start_codon:yes stop_codon:yes gene_type:complete
MFILSLAGKEGEGAYAVTTDDGKKALYLFQQEDDATRYAGLLEANESTALTVVEIDDTMAVETCQRHKYKYVIITPNDIVIPPKDYDNIQDD